MSAFAPVCDKYVGGRGPPPRRGVIPRPVGDLLVAPRQQQHFFSWFGSDVGVVRVGSPWGRGTRWKVTEIVTLNLQTELRVFVVLTGVKNVPFGGTTDSICYVALGYRTFLTTGRTLITPVTTTTYRIVRACDIPRMARARCSVTFDHRFVSPTQYIARRPCRVDQVLCVTAPCARARAKTRRTVLGVRRRCLAMREAVAKPQSTDTTTSASVRL